MTLRQRKILIKSVALTVCLLAMLYIAIFDCAISMDYSARGYNPASVGYSVNDPLFTHGYSPLYWFLFFTHLSDVAATTWLLLSWSSVVFRNEKLENRLNGQYTKMIPFSMILLTGFIFGIFAYIPTVLRYTDLNADWASIDNPWKLEMSKRTYGILEIFATTCKHIFIPGTFLALVFLDPDYPAGPSKQRKRERAVTLFMVLTVYTIWVILVLSYSNVKAPYPFFDWSLNESALWIPLINRLGITALINLLCFVFIGIAFEFISLYTMLYWEKVNKRKESTEEIVISLEELDDLQTKVNEKTNYTIKSNP